MPQMMPMFWTFLLLMTLIIFFLALIYLYFLSHSPWIKNFSMKMYKTPSWKWKW